MSKKRVNKRNSATKAVEEQNRLPQNIVSMGEKVEENKNIYIAQSVYTTVHRFTEGKTVNESGGMLIGSIIEEFGKTNIVIVGFIEAKYCEATPTTLKFTHETWDYCHKEMGKKYPGQKIVGWIHTHPNFGIFLSEYDKFIQENFFKEDYEIAYVVDPIQEIEGFYFWINGKIERCKGFYVFEKTGKKINMESDSDIMSDHFNLRKSTPAGRIAVAVLALAIAILAVVVINLNGKIKTLQLQQETIVSSANQSLSYMQQQILELQTRLNTLESDSEADVSDASDEVDSPSSNENNTQGNEEGTDITPEEGSAP